MKKLFRALLATTLLVTTQVPSVAQTQFYDTQYEFADTNPLATGHWVKITITGSGMYEISHDRLREMGFSNPEQVGVYGTGGQKRSYNFVDNSGTRLLEDVISAVPVTHHDGKLIFYGQGDRVLRYQGNRYGSGNYPCFRREAYNTCSETTSYMLTDSHPALPVETHAVADRQEAVETPAFGVVYHEAELFNGPNDSGENWYGEKISVLREVEFDITAKYCRPNENAYTYSDIAVVSGYNGNLVIKLNKGPRSYSLQTLSVSNIQSWDNLVNGTAFTVDENNVGTGTLSFALKGSEFPDWDLLAVDYWTVVYPSSFALIDSDPDFTQFTAGFNHESDAVWKHHLPAGARVWDITDPAHPFELESDGTDFYSNAASPRSVVAFNPSKTLKQINEGWEPIANQNLHALKQNAYDMVIFTVESLKTYAERLAQAHAETDGQRVAVVLDSEIYNEFNAGTPDPMCYRLLAKMLYHHPEHSLKNVLFFGPMYGDMRNLRNIPNRIPGMIAFQDFNIDLRSISNPNMDFYGIMTDKFTTSRMESAPVSLGVGILPLDNDQDAQLVVDKVRAHLSKEDFSGMVNETYTIGCAGDSHIHENQSIKLGKLIQNIAGKELDSEFAHESLWLESMTPQHGRDMIQSAMRRGKSFITYFGHAGREGFLNGTLTVFDAMNAGNNEQGVALFAGCDLLEHDRGIHGMGDMPVIRSRSGFIGAISATRSVLSNHNEGYARNFTESLFYDASDKLRTSTPTLGEVYARSKDKTANNSELAYVYVGDPSLRVPVALSKVELYIPDRKYRAGETVEVTGYVVNNETGKVRSDYNGFVTLKLMEPTRMVVTPPVTSATQSKMEDYPINDLPIIAVNGTVKKGRFKVRVPLPTKVNSFMSETEEEITNLLLLGGTFDNSTWLGGSGRVNIPMAVVGSEPDPDGKIDNVPPTVTISYNDALGVIEVKAIDDVALVPGIGNGAGITLFIDDQEMSLGQNYSEGVYPTSFRGSVDMARLSNGVHTATVTGCDLAGNISESKTIKFSVASTSQLTLQAGSPLAIDEISFSIKNDYSGDLSLLIIDRDGNIVSEDLVSGKNFSADTTELAAGTYRAYVNRNSPEGVHLRSNMVEFTVIK